MKVLVVDDDPVSLLVAATSVETLGHAVDTATIGLAAWERLEQEHYDVLVTDRGMPGLDGLASASACARERTSEGTVRPAATATW